MARTVRTVPTAACELPLQPFDVDRQERQSLIDIVVQITGDSPSFLFLEAKQLRCKLAKIPPVGFQRLFRINSLRDLADECVIDGH